MSALHCPNKNTVEFKEMAKHLGDKAATAVWYLNKGNPIWETNTGETSKLWLDLVTDPRMAKGTAMQVKMQMYTNTFLNSGVTVNEFGEPSVKDLLDYIEAANKHLERLDLYKSFNLLDKRDPNKVIKWKKTSPNYKKVVGIAANINSGQVASAKVIEALSEGVPYYTIALTPKAAFATQEGEQVAYFDSVSGEITFTDKGLTAETVVHEFSHPFIDAISKHNPELFKNLIDEIKQDSKIPEIKKILDHVDVNYADAGSEIKDKELLAYTISEYGRGNIDVSTGKNTANAIKKFYKWVSDLAKELQSMLRAGGTVYVDAIHPKTKYRDVANLFTVMSEVGTINLGVESKKIAPVTDASKAEAKKANMAAKRAARRKEKGISPNKLVKTSTSNFVDIKNEADHLATLLPKEIAIKLSPGYLKVLSGGRAVVGMFQDSMVHLSQTGPKGTAYHEGFHAVFRTLLEGKEQSSLIKDIKSVTAKPLPKDILDLEMQHDIDATEAENIYYEEILADAFAEYMDGDIAFQYPKGVLGFFQQLKDWLNHVFFNTVTTQKVFRDIKLGKYAKRKPNITRGVAYKVHPVFTNIADVNQITKELASVAFKDIRTIDDLRKNKISIELIEQRLLDSQIEAEDSGNTDLADNIDSIFDEDGEQIDSFWVNEIDSYLRNSLGLKPKPHKATTAIDKIVQDTDDYQEANDKETSMFKKASYEVSGKVNATAAVKFMVAMTPSVQLIDPSKPATISNTEEVISPLTGLPVLVDYGTFYNDLESTLSNIVSVNRNGKMTDPLQDMISTLKVHAQHKPEMLSFATKIEESEDTVTTDVFATFSRQKGRYLHHQIKGTSDMDKVARGEMPLRSDFTTGTFNEKSGVILDGWISSFNRRFGIVDGNTIIYNKSAIDDFFIKRYEVSKLVEENAKEVDLRDGVLSTSTIKAFERLLASLGVDIDARTIDYIITSRLEDVSETEYHQEYSLEFGQLFKQFMDATNGLMLKEGDIFGDNNQIQDNKSFFKQTLANADGYFKKVSGEASFVGPGGNTIYTYQANDSVSKIIGAVKQGDLTHINRVLKSAYGKNSVWAKAMVDQLEGQNNIDAFETVMYGNLKSEKTLGDKGAKASELKPIDAYMDNVNKTMSGYFIGLAEADKSRQTYFTGMPTEKIGLSIKTEDGKKSYAFNNKRGYEILKGYLADELSRMDIAHGVVYGDPAAGIPKKDESKWTIYYHYYPVAPGTGTIGENLDKIPGNAFNSFLFPDIDLKKHGLQNEDGFMIARGKTNFDNNEAIKGEIIRAFGKLVTDELLHAEAVGLIQRDKTGELYNKLISSSVTEQYTQGGVTNITRLMGDYVLNSIIGNIEQTKLFNGDPANYKVKGVGKQPWKELNHFGDLQKRVPAIFAAGTDFRIYNTKDGVPVVPQNYTSATIANIEVPSAFFGEINEEGKSVFNMDNLKELSKVTGVPVDELKDSFKAYLEINQTDAQAWVTLDVYKERMLGLGKWSDAHEGAYQKAVDGQNISATELKLLAQPLKTVHAELVFNENAEMIMHYNKQSEAVLLPFMKDMEIGKLLKAMENKNNPIGHVIVLDGKKAGASGIEDIIGDDGNIKEAKDIKMNAVQLSYNNLFLQQDLTPHGIDDTLVGSQSSKNVLSVVKLDGEYFHDKNGQEVVDIFHKSIGRLSDLGLIELDKAIGYDPVAGKYNTTTDQKNTPVHQLLQKEFEGEASENHINAMDDNIVFDSLPIKDKIMSKLMSIVTKRTVKLKQPGGALIQLSDLGMIASETKLSDKVKNGIIWFKDPATKLNPMHAKDGSIRAAQILMPHGQIVSRLAADKAMVKIIEQKFGTSDFKELTHTQIKSLLSPEILEGFSYRIPNQGASSNDAFEIVGILPQEMGDTMIAFSDITMKTGSDFDIDKAFVVVPNFYVDNSTGKIEKVGYDINDIPNMKKKSLQNLRLDLMRQMLMHPSAYTSVMAPLDNDGLEKFIKELYPEKTKLRALEYFTGRFQLGVKSTFDGAKALVGSIANHMTHHSLALADNLYFEDYYLGKGVKVDDATNISNKIDELGGNVGATLNAYMNAIVDAAKDPFIVRANLNLTTANTTFMLVRAGVDPKWIASFIGQPAIKAIVDAQNAKEGRFGEITKDKSGKILSPIEVVLAKYGLEGVSEANFRGGKEYKGLRNSVADDIIISTDKLGSEIASGGSNELQLRVLKQFLEWQSKASELNDVVKVSKADVEGATKSLITAELAVNLLHRVIDSKAIGNVQKMLGIYKDERTGLLSIPQDEGARMTGRYFNNSVLAARERFSGLFLGGSRASLNAVKDIAKLSGYETLTTGQTMEEIALSITSNVYTHAASKTRLFNISPERLHSILYGRGKMALGVNAKLSIGARVEMAKASDELKDNLFIQALQVRPGRDGAPDNVYMPNNEVVKETKDSLFYAWEQLIAADQSEDSLGRDLVLYSFFTSGFSKSVGDFSEHIPYTYLKSQGFPQDMAAMNLEYNDNSHKLQSEDDIFFKNMYADNRLVPTVHKDAVRALNKADASKFIVNTDYAFAIPQLNAANYSIGTSPEGDHVFKRYVKRKIVTKNKYGKDVVDFYLFKRVGYTQAKAAMYVRVNTLGISGGGNNVTEYIGDGNTSIFPKNNVTLPNDLQQLVEASYKKSELTGEEYINKVEEDITDFTSEDRVLFCIMQS